MTQHLPGIDISVSEHQKAMLHSLLQQSHLYSPLIITSSALRRPKFYAGTVFINVARLSIRGRISLILP